MTATARTRIKLARLTLRVLLAWAVLIGLGQAQPAPAAIELPQLLEFVEADYPPHAKQQGLQARVSLKLEIDAEGRVTQAEVVEPKGHGFDEAALAAARRFIFAPATRNGKPVPSKILYEYAFHLEPQVVPAGPPKTATLRGVVKASSAKLAGVSVTLTSPDGSERTLTSDAKGHWSAEELPPGRYRLSFSAPGFEPYTTRERLDAGEDVAVAIQLVPLRTAETEADDGTLNIVVHGERPSREVTRRTVSRKEMTKIPGTSGDALRALQNLPGVARPPSLSGLLVVRGTPATSTLVFVESMFLPNVYHLGGLTSVIPTELMESIDFYPGNYSVRFGRALGGVVDIGMRRSRDDGKYHGMLSLDLIDAQGLAEGPITDDWNVIAGFRRSHVDAWIAPILENEETTVAAAPVYLDYQVLADTRPDDVSYLRLGVLGYDDHLRIISSDRIEGGALDTRDQLAGGAVLYVRELSPTLSLETNLTFARLSQRFQLSSILFETVAWGVVGRSELSWRMWPSATLVSGVDLLAAPFKTKARLPEDPGPNAPPIGSFATTPTRAIDKQEAFFQPAVFAEMQMTPNDRTRVVSGVRVDYDHFFGNLDVSPRLNARYDIAHDYPKTTLKGGTGLFFQPGTFDVAMFKDEDTKLRSMVAWQNSLGVEQELTRNVDVSAESFYYYLGDLISRRAGSDGAPVYTNEGQGRVVGLELMLRYKASERFFGWLAYTLSRSERRWADGEETMLFNLDQTHILTALASYDLGGGWELGARFRYTTGNLYEPCRGGIFSSSSSGYLCVPSDTQQRLAPFRQLDLRADKTWKFESFELGAYLELINVENRTNPDFIGYNYNYTQSQAQTASLPLVPSLGVRGEF